MELYVGLDVGLEETNVCNVDKDGNSVRETKVATEPEAIRCALEGFAECCGCEQHYDDQRDDQRVVLMNQLWHNMP